MEDEKSINRDALQLRKKTGPVLQTGKFNKPILIRKESCLKQIIYDGKDLTPQPLRPELFVSGKERHIGTIDISSTLDAKSSQGFSTVSQMSHGYLPVGTTVMDTRGSLLSSMKSLQNILTEVMWAKEDSATNLALPVFQTEIETAPPEKPPSELRLILNETETFFLLDIPSYTELKNTEEGDKVDQLNSVYEFLTSEKGRHRKVKTVEVQTAPILQKTRYTEAASASLRDTDVFASEWDMFDTYKEEVLRRTTAVPVKSDSEDDYDQMSSTIKSSSYSMDGFKDFKAEKEMKRLMKNANFLEALCITERILANNCFSNEQKRFCGLIDPDMEQDEMQYKYSLRLLWTFANSDTKDLSVNKMEWNPKNKNLLAVGYGKFYYEDKAKGLVLIWNIKNPVQPERQYKFERPVTTLSFSMQNPNVLAIGFYTGDIVIINVTERELKIINSISLTFDPIWDLYWMKTSEKKEYNEQICVCLYDGRVLVLQIYYGKTIKTLQIMRIGRFEGTLPGIKWIQKCSKIDVPITGYSPAKLFVKHPSQKDLYYVCCLEGTVNLCSTYYMNKKLDQFLAHIGPINGFKFSQFCPKVFATCGDDWYIRLWVNGIQEPLLELYRSMDNVCGIDWSPIHSTILVSISGKDIIMWDLQRKAYEPQSVTTSPANAKCTRVQFVESGRCLIVGDIKGNVQVFSVESMPYPPFFQENLLYASLEKALITKPDLIYKLNKVRKEDEKISRD